MLSGKGKELLGAAEVAAYLGVNQGTVYRWCRERRLPCVKVGKYWRMRREALEELLAREERPATLTGQLSTFLTAPENLFGVAQTPELLYRLDAAFFRLREASGGMLVKFHDGAAGSEARIRSDLERCGLEAARLEREGRFRMLAEVGSPGSRPEALGRLAAEEVVNGRTIWAAFNWEEQMEAEAALGQQQALAKLAESRRLIIKTSVLEELMDDWSPVTRRRVQTLHTGTIWLSEAGLSLNRVTQVSIEAVSGDQLFK